jgi:hypothetical protein
MVANPDKSIDEGMEWVRYANLAQRIPRFPACAGPKTGSARVHMYVPCDDDPHIDATTTTTTTTTTTESNDDNKVTLNNLGPEN